MTVICRQAVRSRHRVIADALDALLSAVVAVEA
jgi:hypothetical protein